MIKCSKARSSADILTAVAAAAAVLLGNEDEYADEDEYEDMSKDEDDDEDATDEAAVGALR